MTLEAFLAEYVGHIVGSFAIGWAIAKLIKYFQILLEKI